MTDIDIDQKVAFLCNPAAHADLPDEVEVVETYMSWVFLTAADVYKLKKPIKRNGLDFGDAGARYQNCLAEVELNRRLARDIYYGVVALSPDADGSLRLTDAGTAEAVDWLVHMRRLPSANMLDARINRGDLERPEVETLARFISDFYHWAPRADYTPVGYIERLTHSIENDRQALARPHYDLPEKRIADIARAQQVYVEEHADEFADRVEQRRVREVHGDLRPEHILVADEPQIIDCLEFNREFRLLDPVDELAYLSLECERLGADEVGDIFMDIYRQRLDDFIKHDLIAFYKSCRAVLRAKLCVWHLEDERHRARKDWYSEALYYLDRAEHHAGLMWD